ncbi:hypothetical protein KEM56_004553, partial [Ascosphaera pollenicola]
MTTTRAWLIAYDVRKNSLRHWAVLVGKGDWEGKELPDGDILYHTPLEEDKKRYCLEAKGVETTGRSYQGAWVERLGSANCNDAHGFKSTAEGNRVPLYGPRSMTTPL